MSVAEQTVKVILVSCPSRTRYPKWVWRVVYCRADQKGYMTERGVLKLWQSQPLYRPLAKRGQGPKARARAEKIAVSILDDFLGIKPG